MKVIILFKSKEDNSSDKPYLEILNTPNVAQKIQGVKISHFGVEAVSGKHVRLIPSITLSYFRLNNQLSHFYFFLLSICSVAKIIAHQF